MRSTTVIMVCPTVPRILCPSFDWVGARWSVYLCPNENGSQTDPETVTEIQFPVEKVSK